MVVQASLILVLLVIFSCTLVAIAGIHNHNNQTPNGSTLAGMELPEHMSFNAVSSSSHTGCSLSSSKKTKQSDSTMEKAVSDNEESDDEDDEVVDDSMTKIGPHKQSVKLHLRHRSLNRVSERKSSVIESTVRDLVRIQTLHTRIVEKKNQNTISRLQKDKKVHEFKPVVAPAASPESYTSELSGQLQATLKSGVSLGSGEYFMDVFIGTPPKHFSLILDTGSDLNWVQCAPCYACFEQDGPHYDPKDSTSFRDISCQDPRCRLVSSPDPPQPCKAENQTCPYFYWYGDSSNTTGDFSLETFTVNLTSHTGKADFKRVENVMFGCGHWNRGLFHGAAGLLGLGRGPLSFASQLQSLYGHSFSYYPAYQIIKEAFSKKVKGYPVVKDFPFLDPCYNVSGVEKIELPEFAILFADGAVWDFPVENYFIQIDPQEVVCLAVLGTPKSGLSIIGNYQQQNFHILYDTKKSRLGYAPMKCADV
ncbi:hypothetical protein GBA52_010923 [Prunus armeniaca]|nr:hypothetical protein GBA52_010923 [Prunus armeniaca]